VTVTELANRTAPRDRKRGRRPVPGVRRLSTRATLALGLSVTWFSLLVLIPLAAVVVQATAGGWSGFVDVLNNPQTIAALRLTVTSALIITAINVFVGPIIAWVLTRDRFPGAAIFDVIIDIPFALPTIVAGLVLLALYGPHSPLGVNIANTQSAVFFALAFVTLPFVVRTIQPVLEELDTDGEEAAASLGARPFVTFRRIVLPSLVPAIAAGASMSFARGISEYGSLVLLSGNLPYKTEVASVRVVSYIENGEKASAAVVASILLVVALAVIVALDVIQRRVARRG
jgi:sulfate transport system permease protein